MMNAYPEDELELSLARLSFVALALLWMLLPSLLTGLRAEPPTAEGPGNLIHSAYPEKLPRP